MRILVKTANVIEEVTQKGNTLYKQAVLLDQGNEETLSFRVTIQQGKPYAPGVYDLAPGSFVANRFRSLELDPYNIRLIPLAADARSKAA